MSKISYFILRTFDVMHHAAHGTILIRDESKEKSVNITYLASSDCQSSHANPILGGGGAGCAPAWICACIILFNRLVL
jgi:hypothetical protein